MRVALQRLLSQPSSSSLLRSLVVSPVGLESLNTGRECYRCRERRARHIGYNVHQRRFSHSASVTADRESAEGPQPAWESTGLIPEEEGHWFEPYAEQNFRPKPHYADSTEGVSNFLSFTDENLALDPAQLEVESDVGHTMHMGTKAVDQPENANNWELWKELLMYRHRHYGTEGIITVWKGIRERGTPIDLPVEGNYADFFWDEFTTAALKNRPFLQELEAYARDLYQRTGRRWHPFYEAIVGRFLARDRLGLALRWHQKLSDIHLSSPNDILCVFRLALKTVNGIETFRKMCKSIEGHQIYNSVVPVLWKHRRANDALTTHKFLTLRGDKPTGPRDFEIVLRYLRMYRSHMHDEIAATVTEYTSLVSKMNAASEAKKSEGSSEKPPEKEPPIKEKHFDDTFGARLFATRAFTFELLLSGLKMFSVSEIGPLSLREMALRAHNAEEVHEQIQMLRKEGISTGNSVFSQVVEKLAAEKSDKLLRDVLQSDQHPDMLESVNIQERLLTSYYLSQDWDQVARTLSILSVLSTEDPHAYNVRLRNALRLQNWPACTALLERMKASAITPTPVTVTTLLHTTLPPRRLGKAPATTEKPAISFALATLQHMLQCGGSCAVPPTAWREPLRRAGMSGQWAELRAACLWLARYYAPLKVHARRMIEPRLIYSTPTTTTAVPTAGTVGVAAVPVPVDRDRTEEELLTPSHPRSPLRIIFSVEFQRAILAWPFLERPVSTPGAAVRFRNPFGDEDEMLVIWARGVTLLRELRELGVVAQTNTVKRVCRHRLAMLYGQPKPSNMVRNQTLRRENEWKLEEVLADLDKAWGTPLFKEFTSKGDYYGLVNPARLKKSMKTQELQLQRLIGRSI